MFGVLLNWTEYPLFGMIYLLQKHENATGFLNNLSGQCYKLVYQRQCLVFHVYVIMLVNDPLELCLFGATHSAAIY